MRVVLAAALCGLSAAAHAAERPRIVSINPCVDAILVQVADARQIAAISHYSRDPEATSIPFDVARRYAVTSGTAEEVIALSPDLVMSGQHVSPSTIFALERMHVPLMNMRPAESVEESERQIRQIAAAAGEPERGEKLVASIQRALAAAQPRGGGKAIPALMWQGGGMVPGAGTLADQLLQLTGFENVSTAYGLRKWDELPLEYLLASPPELVLSLGVVDNQGDRTLQHPAVLKLADRVAFRSYPFQLLQCGGPTIVQAVARLAELHREMEAR